MSRPRITVINSRSMTELDRAYGIYVGRGSPLGNPYRVGPDGTREQVIEKYRHWLDFAIREKKTEIMVALRYIAAKHADHLFIRLICYCAPLPCHADVIAEVVERYVLTGEWKVW